MPRRLALELYHTIIHDVNDTNDLLSLALCCSAFRGEAQRFLFRHADPKSLGQRTQLISTINASPLRLGPLVHTFYIRHELGSDEVNYSDEDDHVVSLSSALRAMYNLKHLRNEGVQMTLTVLRGCIFKLHTLVWNCSLDKSKMLFLLCDFLPAQHSIKHLQFCHMAKAGIIEVPANLCPNLNSLGAIDEFTIKALLRDNRLITRFQWHGSGAVPRMSIRQLNRLEYLLCGMNELNISPSFTLHLTSLVFLEVPINIVATLILSFQIQFLRNLPRLEVLVFHIIGNINFITGHNTFGYRDVFKVCPTLKYIDAGQEGDPFYDRYLRPENGDNVGWVSRRVEKQEVLGWRREYGVGLS